MKPNWRNAPAWANYHACDSDGQCYWFENKPYQIVAYGMWVTDDPAKYLYHCNTNLSIDWRKTLKRRPV